MQMDGQDWTTVIIKKKLNKEEERKKNGIVPQPKPRQLNSQTKSDIPAFKLEQEDYKPPVVTSNMSQQIIQGRLAKKWNQEQLAKEAQIPIGIIKAYEKATPSTVVNQGYVQKISKAIGIQIKK